MTAANPSLTDEFRLGPDDTHVWHSDLADAQNWENLLGLLDDEERSRASRLRIAEDWSRFVAAHAYARILIGRYLGCAPQSVRFGYGAHGKPHILLSAGQPVLRFNASRSGKYAAFALTLSREIGVDVEEIAARAGIEMLIARVLTQNERAHLDSRTSAERELAFFTFWARKEAILKARGLGLSIQPNQVETASPDALRIKGEPETGWRIEDVALAPGYAAAVAGEGREWRVTAVRPFIAPARC